MKYTMNIRVIVVAILAFLPMSFGQPKLTFIDKLGMGYDGLEGNPLLKGLDPGFRSVIVNHEYTNNLMSTDGIWLVPNFCDVHRELTCSNLANNYQVMGSSSYQQTLSLYARIPLVDAGAFAFKGDVEFETVRKECSSYHKMFMYAIDDCISYKATLRQNSYFVVTDEFTRSVQGLPGVFDEDGKVKYMKFITDYGTHYVSELWMGAMVWTQSVFSEESMKKMFQQKFNIEAVAEASSINSNFGLSYITEETTMFDSLRSSNKTTIKGQPPPQGKVDFVEWFRLAVSDPYPIRYILKPITDLFVEHYIANLNETELKIRRYNLNATLEIYCERVPECLLPLEDDWESNWSEGLSSREFPMSAFILLAIAAASITFQQQ